MQYRTALQDKNRVPWTKPDWFSNPFANPVAFKQIAGFALVAMGLTGLLTSAQKGHAETMNLFPFAVGLGLVVSSTIFFAFNER